MRAPRVDGANRMQARRRVEHHVAGRQLDCADVVAILDQRLPRARSALQERGERTGRSGAGRPVSTWRIALSTCAPKFCPPSVLVGAAGRCRRARAYRCCYTTPTFCLRQVQDTEIQSHFRPESLMPTDSVGQDPEPPSAHLWYTQPPEVPAGPDIRALPHPGRPIPRCHRPWTSRTGRPGQCLRPPPSRRPKLHYVDWTARWSSCSSLRAAARFLTT